MLIETLEPRQLLSTTPAAPSPVPIPYPNAVVETEAAAKKTTSAPKVTLSDLVVVKTSDKPSPTLQ